MRTLSLGVSASEHAIELIVLPYVQSGVQYLGLLVSASCSTHANRACPAFLHMAVVSLGNILV